MVTKVRKRMVIKCPIEAVFAFVSDLEQLPRWTSSLDEVTKINDGPIAVGTVFHEKGTFMGRTVDSYREITAFEPPRFVSFAIREGTIPGKGSYTFAPVAEGTEMTFVGEAELGWFMKLLAPLLTRLMQRQFAADGATLKALLEAEEKG